MKCKFLLLSFIMAMLFIFAVPAYANDIEFIYPSAEDSAIAPGCDFYVIGTFEDDVQADGLLVQLFAASDLKKPLRIVYTSSTEVILNYNYENLSYYGDDINELKNSYMPDLVYDPAVAGSFKDVWRKCCLGDGFFTVVISGGVYDEDINLVDGSGKKLQPLAAGDYVLVVTVKSGDKALTQSMNITLGDIPDKMCTRFSPDAHMDVVNDFAKQKGWHIYEDLFAGYWDTSKIEPLEGSGIFAEILPKWHEVEYLEYSTGNVHVVLYNINEECCTNKVELGTLQQVDRVDDATYYYYDIGEPELMIDNTEKEGLIVPLDSDDHLALTRVETGNIAENKYDLTNPGTILTTNPSSIDCTKGDISSLAIFGVVTPLQNEAIDITDNGDGTYTANNIIAQVKYTVSDEEGNVLDEFNKEVSLTRQFEADWSDTSIYEFAHVIDVAAYEGQDQLVIELVGIDAKGALVGGTEESITIDLRSTQFDNSIFTYVLLVMLAIIAVVVLLILFLTRRKKH